jgi:LysR family transcriptional regulator, glycine cleavage system transcriptional activator
MRRRLPPLHQIEAFLIAAGSPSFRVAAERCALSPAAFSRRIQEFSTYVGEQLFERSSGSARLTEAGRRALGELEPAYVELRRVTAALGRDSTRNREVKLSLSHALAVGWLVPRLNSFRKAHPAIEVSFKIQRDASALRCGDVDIGICAYDIDLSGLDTQPLFQVDSTPVASPTIAKAFRCGDGRLDRHRLLALAYPADAWPMWARSAGCAVDSASFIRFDMVHAMYEAASEGHGIGLGLSPTIWPHLESGRLERLELPVAHYPGGYRLAASAERRRQSAVATFWQWLESEAARTPRL